MNSETVEEEKETPEEQSCQYEKPPIWYYCEAYGERRGGGVRAHVCVCMCVEGWGWGWWKIKDEVKGKWRTLR